MNPATKFNRIAAFSLSALLCFTMIPLAGCAGEQETASEPSSTAKPIGAAEDPGGSALARTIDYDPSGYLKPEEKWASFDDGSNALDIVETHVFANAAKQSLTVKLENGAELSGDVAVEDVALTGGLSAWKPVSVAVASPTELTVTAELGSEEEPSTVAAVAGIEIASACIALPEVDTADIDAQIEEMIASNPDEELIEGFEDESEADAGTATAQTQSQPVANNLVAMAYADESDAADASPYEAFIPYVHPGMQIDVADTVAGDGKTTYRIVACEFAFPENISASDLVIELASTAPAGSSAPALESVKRLGDFEIEVVVADDASKIGSICDYAALRLSEQASGTGGAVSCALTLPDVWVDVEVTEINDAPAAQFIKKNAGDEGETGSSSEASSVTGSSGAASSDSTPEVQTVTVNAMVHNTDGGADDLKVGVFGGDGAYREVTDAVVEELEDGSVDVTVNTDALANLAGTDKQASDSSAASEGAEAESTFSTADVEEDSLIISAGEFDATTTANPATFKMIPLSQLIHEPAVAVIGANLALQGAYLTTSAIEETPVANSGFDFVELAKGGAKSLLSGIAGSAWSYVRSTWLLNTPLGEHTINQLYNEIVKMQTDLSNMAAALDDLSSKESAHYNASIVNAANAKIARIQSEYSLIGGLYKQVIAADGNEAATAAAIDNLMGAKKTTVDNLIVDMGELYNTIKVADASTGASLIKVYDNMAALSYNWGAAAAPARQSYRDTISEVWVGCATMLYVICGADAYKDEYSVSLTNLENMTKEVNALLDKNPVNANDYERAAGSWTFKSSNTFVKAEGKAYFCYTTNEWYAMCPGSTSNTGWDKAFYTVKKRGRFCDYFSSNPFISWRDDGRAPSWSSYYLTTAQIKSMVSRLGSNRSLLGELASFYSLGDVRYLVCDPSFSMQAGKTWHNENNWRFDTYEYNADKTATTFTSKKLHFEGDVYQVVFKSAKHTVVSSTPAESMMAIAKVTVK